MNLCVIFLSIVVGLDGHSVSCASLEQRSREGKVVVMNQEDVSIAQPRGGGIVRVGEFLTMPLFSTCSAISGGIKQKQTRFPHILHSLKKSLSDSTNRNI